MKRRVPGALALGLLAAYAAHSIAFGNDHVMGGPYADVLRTTASVATLAFTGMWIAIGWINGGYIRNGSVFNAATSKFTPSTVGVFTAALGWFCFAESVEHGQLTGPSVLAAVALLLASVVVNVLSRTFLRAMTRIVFAAISVAFRRRLPNWLAIADERPSPEPFVRTRRLFSRPPPIGSPALS
jgi:hypothetical protein